MKNTALNLFCVVIGICLILAGVHNFLSASPGTSGLYKEFLAFVGFAENISVDISKENITLPGKPGEGVKENNEINVLIEDALTREDIATEETHIHSWKITQEYNWVDLGNGRGYMEITDVEKCDCGATK